MENTIRRRCIRFENGCGHDYRKSFRSHHRDLKSSLDSRMMASHRIMIGLVVLAVLSRGTRAVDFNSDCQNTLGMQSGQIPDKSITASTSYDADSVGAENARIRTEVKGGAWCPEKEVDKDVYEWLQIDLGTLTVITMVETQGRFGNGQGQEYADQYLLEYQREADGPWFRFRNRKGQEIIQGNTNTYISELRELNPPIIVRRIRFVPYSAHARTVCMRVELYGCKWRDGVVSYNMPQGERRGSEVDLYDFTYDGTIQDDYLSGGMGQLTDREDGQSNFRLDPHNMNIKGYEWMGWRNETFGNKPVEIIFKFDTVRNFTSLRIHANNLFPKDVRVFKVAKLYFSVGGEHYLGKPIVFEYMRDTLIDYARNAMVPLNHSIGQYIKLQLYFDSKWMLISEVEFTSEVAVGDFPVEVPPSTEPPVHRKPKEGILGGGEGEDDSNVQVIDLIPDQKTNSSAKNPGDSPELVDSSSTSVSVLDTSTAKKTLEDEYIGVIIGALAALLLLLFVVVLIIVVRHRKRKYNNNHRAMKSIEPRHITLNLNDLQNAHNTNGKLQNGGSGSKYTCVAQSDADIEKDGLMTAMGKLDNLAVASAIASGNACDYGYGEHIQGRKLPDLPCTPESTDTCTSREYAVPDLTKSSLIVQVPGGPTLTSTLSTPPPAYSLYGVTNRGVSPTMHAPPVGGPYASADVVNTACNIPNIQGVSGNTVYALPNNVEPGWPDDMAGMQFPRDSLKFVEQLGEGQFGEVHLCEAVDMNEYLGDDFLINRTGSCSMLVAIKTLRRNADDQARTDFYKEVKIMCGLKDPNIVRVLGVCTVDEPLCVIVEYMKYGDLHQFLQDHVPGESTISRNAKTLSYGCLIYMASQIASGMKYLESFNMVHRDLAARNCLVGTNYTIKISDFGMSRSLYSTDYYRIEGRAVLPIRWMAWESILLGKFSTKSDIWSFGVTLWEILTFAREQPYNHLTDEQVIENSGHFYRNDELECYLPPPVGCPREIFDLIKECWNREEISRPSFREIHMFMQRKGMGYNPRDDAGNSHVAMV